MPIITKKSLENEIFTPAGCSSSIILKGKSQKTNLPIDSERGLIEKSETLNE